MQDAYGGIEEQGIFHKRQGVYAKAKSVHVVF